MPILISAKRLPFVLLAALSVAACGKTAGSSTTAPGPDVWATVDGRNITRDDVEKAYRGSPPNPTPTADDDILTQKLNVLDNLIDQDIMVARAQAAKLDVTDAEVDTAIADRRAGMTDAEFQMQLAQQGLTPDDVKRGVRRELLVQKLIDRDITGKATITDDQIADYYNRNRAQFNLAEPQYHLAQIVVTSAHDPQVRNRMHDDAGTPEEAQRKVAMIAEKLRGGTDFGQLAADYSEDPQTAGQGGDLGFVPLSTIARNPQLRDVVVKMQPGNVNTINLNGNYTILLMAEALAAGQRDLSTPAVKNSVRDMLKAEKEELLRAAYVTAARNDARVANYLAQQVVAGKPPAATVTK